MPTERKIETVISNAVLTAGVPEVLDHVRRGEREENKVRVGSTASEAGKEKSDRPEDWRGSISK